MIYAFIATLLIIILILIILLLFYRRQIKEICRQLKLLIEHDSILIIKTDYSFRTTNELAEKLNQFLKKYRQEKNIIVKKENAIADIYTNISHDIRTPLTSIDGYVKLLAESDSASERERYIAVIEERVDCLNDMLEELFTFTKLKNEAWQLNLVKCSFSRALKETLVSYYNEWKCTGIIPSINVSDSEVYCMGNEVALKRVFQNILKNALEHGGKELNVILETDDCIKLEIGNTLSDGSFIDTDKIFEKFYKADEARSRTSTGLGLSIAKEFVERMDGSIYARQNGRWFYIGIEIPLLRIDK